MTTKGRRRRPFFLARRRRRSWYPKAMTWLQTKTYWRKLSKLERFHCFRVSRHEDSKKPLWVSLCGDYELTRLGGQHCRRPEPVLRCGLCDAREISLFKKNESLPTTEPVLLTTAI